MTDTLDDTRVIIHLEHHAIGYLVLFHQFFFPFLCVHVHRTELVYLKKSAVLAYSGLRKEDRTRSCYVNQWCYKQKTDSGHQHSGKTGADVDCSLHKKLPHGYNPYTSGQYGIFADSLHDFPLMSVILSGKTQMGGNTHSSTGGKN